MHYKYINGRNMKTAQYGSDNNKYSIETDWYLSEENLKRLNISFEIYNLKFYCLGICDRGKFFSIDFYTNVCPDSLKILTSAKVSINGNKDRIDIIKKCVSYKPHKQRKVPVDVLHLCHLYNIDISSASMLERIEIYKPENINVDELTVTFLYEKEIFQSEDYDKQNLRYVDNKVLKKINNAPKNSSVALLSDKFSGSIVLVKCSII